MTFLDYVIDASRIREKRSSTPGDAPPAGSLRAGETAVNAADGVIFVGKSDGASGVVPGAEGIKKIVALSQAEYDGLTPDAETLYIITS